MRSFVWAFLPLAIVACGEGDRPVASGLSDAAAPSITTEEADAGAPHDAPSVEPEPLGGAECVTADGAAYVADAC